MGIKKPWLDLMLDSLNSMGFSLNGLKMCELGNQYINVDGIAYSIAKEYFTSLGIDHTSIDINGLDGALPLDLSKPVQDKSFDNHFDVVTNFGISEHVNNQYECFRNIHNFCREGGLFIHGIPRIGHWKNHCNYYYKDDFFEKMSQMNHYRIIKERVLSGTSENTDFLFGVLQKEQNVPFISETDFLKLPVVFVSYSLKLQLYNFLTKPTRNYVHGIVSAFWTVLRHFKISIFYIVGYYYYLPMVVYYATEP